MSPDMKRLIDAAIAADPAHGTVIAIEGNAAEAIVRAVLTELSNVLSLDDKVVAAGATAYHHAEDQGDYIAMDVLSEMLKAILAEPATA